MLRTNLPRALRHLRRRRRWRQIDLADRCGVSRQVISRIERGQLTAVPLRTLVRITEALEASIDLTVRWQGEELDRLIDAGHAGLVQECVAVLDAAGWASRVEVSFNHFGDRGRVDVLAWHPTSRILLVVEVKSVIGKADDLLGRLDVKVRLGPELADTVGWSRPAQTIPALVIGDTRRARRLIAQHDRLFGRFDARGRQALAWLRRPSGAAPAGLLWFASLPNSHGASVTRVGRVRRVKFQP